MTTQLPTDTQDTAVTTPRVCAGIAGARTGDSAVPFHTRTTGAKPKADVPMLTPVTRQYVAALQETPVRKVDFPPLGVLTGTAFHVPACSRAANGVTLPEVLVPASCAPMARQAGGEAQEIRDATSTFMLPLAWGLAAARRATE